MVQLADLQCAFRAQAGNSPLWGQNKPPAKPVVLTYRPKSVKGKFLLEVPLFSSPSGNKLKVQVDTENTIENVKILMDFL